MINRQNWFDTKEFLSFHEGTLQNDPQTVNRLRGALRHFLEWAEEKPFGMVRTLSPTFPAYMAKKKTLAGKSFSFSGSEKDLEIVRMFLTFARSEWPSRYKDIQNGWIETLRVSNRNSARSRLKEHIHYTLDDILKIANVWKSAKTLDLKRDIAAVCLLFLSGMRVDAFASLPIECVSIEKKKVYQLPESGVRTKFRKAIVSNLLRVPELLSIVAEWDELVRSQLSGNDLWYPVMARGEDEFIPGSKACVNRGANFGERLKILCDLADVPYLSPHKLRHGNAVLGLKNVKNMAGLKAISQSLGHSSVQTTDSIYGTLSETDSQKVFDEMEIGQDTPAQADNKQTAPADLQSLLSLLSNPEVQKAIAGVASKQPNHKE